MRQLTAAVIGQLARDLVLTVDRLPPPGSSEAAGSRREQLGGKGANQAVALAQLGALPALVAVAGDDVIGDVLLAQARQDGIDVRSVVRRAGALTGLIVEILEPDGHYRYVEHLPPSVLLSEADVLGAREAIAGADAVLVQLQQPAAAALAAARIGHEAGRLVVLDGEVKDKRLFAYADVVRADEKEAAGLSEDVLSTGPATLAPPGIGSARVPGRAGEAAAPRAGEAAAAPRAGEAAAPRAQGPKLLAIAEKDANVFIWAGGRVTIPLGDAEVVDTTGGGDAFVAALTVALLAGEPYEQAARRATAASGATVTHPGGRPELRDV